MSDDTPHIDPHEERARQALRGLRDHPARPSPAARADARRMLLGDRSNRTARRRTQVMKVLAAAALLLAAVATWHSLRQTVPWEVLAITGDGEVRIDGRRFAVADRDRWEPLVRPDALVAVSDGVDLELLCGDAVLLVITGGSTVTLPEEPGRTLARSSTVYLRSGEVRATTGPGFPGMELRIQASEADAAVTGTTIAVIQNDDGTCLCVLEGSATLEAEAGREVRVPPGRRRVVFKDRRAPTSEAILDMERMKLEMLRDRAATVFDR